MTTTPVLEMLGGEKILGRKVSSPLKLVDALREGLPYSSLQAVVRALGLSRQETSRILSVPLRTLDRRKRQRRLQADESDRLYRLAHIASRVVEVLGSAEHAARWLRHPNRALGGVVPLELLDTEAGARQVDEILGRIEFGMYS
jgi:putative toxin-antitoxin system antitoxin component (TIGR02293 family)